MSETGTLALDGDLTHREVTALWRQYRDWPHGDMPSAIDLSGVERCDSSALALLLEWKSRAAAAGRSLDFHGVPRMLATLAQLSETDEILELQPQSAN